MGQEELDPEDGRTTRSTRRANAPTDRLTPRGDTPRGEPVRADWLSGRTAGRTRRTQTMPSSRQEFVLWLQHGGWRTVAIIAGATFAAILIMLVVFNRAGNSTALRTTPTAAAVLGGGNSPFTEQLQPTVTPPVAATAEAAPVAATGAEFQVTNTGAEGLFLRGDHVVDPGNIRETLPEGTVVTVIGEDFVGSDRVWKNIRSPSGQEGWAASDFLTPAQ